jgi:hypothetical protein
MPNTGALRRRFKPSARFVAPSLRRRFSNLITNLVGAGSVFPVVNHTNPVNYSRTVAILHGSAILHSMMKMIVELLQATVLAALFFGPLFYYFLFVMQP